jgi:hypothetical protein
VHSTRIIHRATVAINGPDRPEIFAIFEGTSEIQRMIIGCTITGLDAR